MLYLMRHGQDDEAYVGGWSSVSLKPEGKQEVYASALWIKENLAIKQILSSDVYRAKQTAEIVAEVLNVPVLYTSELREQNKGLYNGKLRENLTEEERTFMETVTCETRFPEGESLKDLYERMRFYLEHISSLEDNTLLITHRGVINMIYYLLNHVELDMDKKRFGVETASVHELDVHLKKIKKLR